MFWQEQILETCEREHDLERQTEFLERHAALFSQAVLRRHEPPAGF